MTSWKKVLEQAIHSLQPSHSSSSTSSSVIKEKKASSSSSPSSNLHIVTTPSNKVNTTSPPTTSSGNPIATSVSTPGPTSGSISPGNKPLLNLFRRVKTSIGDHLKHKSPTPSLTSSASLSASSSILLPKSSTSPVSSLKSQLRENDSSSEEKKKKVMAGGSNNALAREGFSANKSSSSFYGINSATTISVSGFEIPLYYAAFLGAMGIMFIFYLFFS